jgi:hypothetical protein
VEGDIGEVVFEGRLQIDTSLQLDTSLQFDTSLQLHTSLRENPDKDASYLEKTSKGFRGNLYQ